MIAGGQGAEQAPPALVPLLPELSALPALEELRVEVGDHRLACIPAEWGLPGAFPRLKECARWLAGGGREGLRPAGCSARVRVAPALATLPAACAARPTRARALCRRWRRLVLTAANLEGPLPDLQPGALPRLRNLFLSVVDECSSKQEGACTPRVAPHPVQLPASWGGPGVLPELDVLSANLRNVVGPLPAQWAAGFPRLRQLTISGAVRANQTRDAAGAGSPAAGSARRLPPEWGLPGAFPRIARLVLEGLHLEGPIPEAWQSGLPTLEEL